MCIIIIRIYLLYYCSNYAYKTYLLTQVVLYKQVMLKIIDKCKFYNNSTDFLDLIQINHGIRNTIF